MSAIASVIIPAHNEANVIGRCLTALLADAAEGEFDVVVAANGCTDTTSDIVTAHPSHDVRLVETATPSKIAALNLGDAATSVLPRIYLDADVVIETDTARALARVLLDPFGPAAAAPSLRLDVRGASRPARAYLRIWQSLPVFRTAYVGSGCYALSAAGRARLGAFPDVVNDDQYVNDFFGADEKRTLTGHDLIVMAPRTWRAIVRRSARVRQGAQDVAHTTRSQDSTVRHLMRTARNPRQTGAVAIFIGTQIVVRALSMYRELRGRRGWSRDETSRTSL